jgi:integrase
MQDKFRLYRRPNGMLYAEECATRHRESLQTKNEAEARRLIAAKNQAASQPVFNMEMAKVYLRAHDPLLCERTWTTVSDAVQQTYKGPTKARWEKFIKSNPMAIVLGKKLIQTTSTDFLAVLNHPEARVSTNVFLRILHNRAVDLGWIVQPVILKKAWPKIRYGRRRGITFKEHQKILAVTPREDYRLFFELLWETGGSQTDIASLTAEDIDWPNRRLYYERQKLASRELGRACIAIGPRLEAILKQLPSKGFLFPKLVKLKEGWRSAVFWKRRRAAGIPAGICLHSYRYGWAERAEAAGMPEREAMAHLGHSSRAVHRAYARNANRVTLPLEYYEAARDKKLIDFQAAAENIQAV